MSKWAKYSPEDVKLLYKEIYENVDIWDCHTHIGQDKDGHVITAKDVISQMVESKINKAMIFPLNDPRDNMTFHEPNEEIYDAYRRYSKIFIPFMRLNPHFNWKDEFRLRTDQGFKGIKLHPRSQRFKLSYPKLKKILEKAEKHDLVILMHAGLGLEGVADDIRSLLRRFPKLRFIIGHSGFVDLNNIIKKIRNNKNILFDTSVVRVFDLFDLMTKVDYRKIAFGSDIPYYDMPFSLQTVVDTALYLNKTPYQIRQMLGNNLKSWFKDEKP